MLAWFDVEFFLNVFLDKDIGSVLHLFNRIGRGAFVGSDRPTTRFLIASDFKVLERSLTVVKRHDFYACCYQRICELGKDWLVHTRTKVVQLNGAFPRHENPDRQHD